MTAVSSLASATFTHIPAVASSLGCRIKEVALRALSFLKDWGLVLTGVIGTVVVVNVIAAYPLLSIAGMVGLVILYRNRKKIALTLSLWVTMFKERIGWKKHAWFNEVHKDIVLGGIPLQGKKHPQELQKLGVKGVLSVASEEEESSQSWNVRPVTSEIWDAMKIDYKAIPTQEEKCLSLEDLDSAVRFIHHKANQGEKTYVYCGHGKDRSFLVAACYLVKHGHMRAKEALELIRKGRADVKLYTEQLGRFYEYVDHIA